jgi:5'-phosphate synthase pdxT subunit
MSRLLVTSGLYEPLAERLQQGMAVFGTCAGMILLATEVLDGRPDQRPFGVIDLGVRRNGYGRQVDSFETDLDVPDLDVPDLDLPDLDTPDRKRAVARPFHAVFIRAPLVAWTGPSVEVLARHDGHPVLARQGRVLVASFHPELTPDRRIHAQFLQSVLQEV